MADDALLIRPTRWGVGDDDVVDAMAATSAHLRLL